MEERKVKELNDTELINEFAYANKMSKFYYTRKEEIIEKM
jgi:hypothetical protein